MGAKVLQVKTLTRDGWQSARETVREYLRSCDYEKDGRPDYIMVHMGKQDYIPFKRED